MLRVKARENGTAKESILGVVVLPGN